MDLTSELNMVELNDELNHLLEKRYVLKRENLENSAKEILYWTNRVVIH